MIQTSPEHTDINRYRKHPHQMKFHNIGACPFPHYVFLRWKINHDVFSPNPLSWRHTLNNMTYLYTETHEFEAAQKQVDSYVDAWSKLP